jgi:hypothetical protein
MTSAAVNFLRAKSVATESTKVDAFLASKGIGSGRLVFALDATASREPTWDLAASLQAEMFREAASVGTIEMQLVYYGGFSECRSTPWIRDAAQLLASMQKIRCASGITQIGKILSHVERESTTERVSALVFIGDAMEESPDTLISTAFKLKTPVFMFQEGDDPLAKRTFQDIARATGGAYARFDAGASKRLSELLRAVAAFAVGGVRALEGRKDEASRLLIAQMKDGH